MFEQEKKANANKQSHGAKSGVVLRKDLPCGEGGKRYYDVFEPENKEISCLNPVILYIFPDLFEKNPRKIRFEFCMRLASDGYKVICAGYGENKKKYVSASEGMSMAESLIELLLKNGELNDGKVIICSDGSGSYVAMDYVLRLTENKENALLKPVAVISFDGLYDLKKFAICETSKRFKSKVIKSFTGSELKSGIIPEEIVPKIREVNMCARLKYGFPPFFFAHSAADQTYGKQGEIISKALKLNDICYREYKAVHIPCYHGWQYADGVAAKSLEISLGEFFSAVLSGERSGNEYIEI